ncbi:ribonuclease HI [Aureimonas sp. AU40]|uniref:ribonuclease HI n=1 Tax=Aureimonas sp. AU40 TaxID=1637747 RepID=UPI000781D1D5|nr:ribonuclease HI [Aureimonas sp. AU40]
MSDTPPLPRPPVPHLLIHTDGSCAGNLGPGGWAAVVRVSDESGALAEPVILTGHAPRTTNNRMEMTAAIEALRAFPDGEATIVSDSQYLIKGITEWVRPWKSRNWKNAAGAKVKNRDLWQELDALTAGRTIAWTWIKGHAGHEGNEEADRLASAAGKRAE